jgi:hypothetical protein
MSTDYIFTIPASAGLGTLVSSLYGALPKSKFDKRSSLGIRISQLFSQPELSLHRYPKEFQFAFKQKAANLQGSALPLSYSRNFLNFSNTSLFRPRKSGEVRPLYIKSCNFKEFLTLYVSL